MSRYSKLKEDYAKLEKNYTAEVAKNLDLQYQYDALQAEYQNSRNQQREIERLHDNTRRLKHDMKNHIMVIASHLNNGELDEAKDYLSIVLDNLNRVYSYIQTGNSVLNYIINSKLEYAQQHGIQFKAEIENLTFAKMGSVDFSAVLSNALDNAIEASIRAVEKYIYVSILKKRGYDTITVKNKIDQSVLENNPELRSTKALSDTHGYGVKQIKTITKKYDGMLDIYEDNGMFCTSIMIPS
ncbi:MAG: sensor histidine kinase [Ruminococcus sp.]|nr:sensor histidine kinase [Ruminococcus sp.]